MLKHHNLAVFSLIGIPFIITCLNKSAIGLKDRVNLDLKTGWSNNPKEGNSNTFFLRDTVVYF